MHRLSEFGDAGSLFDLEVPLADQHTDQFASGRHFVTVLIADDTPEDVPQSLAAELRRLDVGGQEIGFGLLVVGSAEEAVAAAVLNDEIQACIIRRDLTLRAAVPLPFKNTFIGIGGATTDRAVNGIVCGR